MIPKIKFKRIPASHSLYFQGDYVTNKVWAFNIPWLESLKNDRSSGIVALKNRVKKERVKAAIDALKGNESHGYKIENLFSSLAVTEYMALDLTKIVQKQGYFKGSYESKETVSIGFNEFNSPILDVEFSPVLFLDKEITAMYKDNASPIALFKSGACVALIMPLNPKNYINKE